MNAFLERHISEQQQQYGIPGFENDTNENFHPYDESVSPSHEQKRHKRKKSHGGKKRKKSKRRKSDDQQDDTSSTKPKKRKSKKSSSKRRKKRSSTPSHDDDSSRSKKKKKKRSKKKEESSIFDSELLNDFDFTGMDAFSVAGGDPYKQNNKKNQEKKKKETSASWLSRVRVPKGGSSATSFSSELEPSLSNKPTKAPEKQDGSLTAGPMTAGIDVGSSSANNLRGTSSALDAAARISSGIPPRKSAPRERKPVKMASLQDFLDNSDSDILSVMSEEAPVAKKPSPSDSTSHSNRNFENSPSPTRKNSPTFDGEELSAQNVQFLESDRDDDRHSQSSHDSDRIDVNLASYLNEDTEEGDFKTSTSRQRKPWEIESPPESPAAQQVTKDDSDNPFTATTSQRAAPVGKVERTKRKPPQDDDISSLQSSDLDPFKFANYGEEEPISVSHLDDTNIQEDDEIMSQSTVGDKFTSAAQLKKVASPPPTDVQSKTSSISSGTSAVLMMADDLSSTPEDNMSGGSDAALNMMSVSNLMEENDISETFPDVNSPKSEAPSVASFMTNESLRRKATSTSTILDQEKDLLREQARSSSSASMNKDSAKRTPLPEAVEDAFDFSLDEFDAPDFAMEDLAVSSEDFAADDLNLDVSNFEVDTDFQKQLETEMKNLESPAQREEKTVPFPAQTTAKPPTPKAPTKPKVTIETQTPYYSASHSYMPSGSSSNFLKNTGSFLNQILGKDYIEKKSGLQPTLLAQNEMFKQQLDMIRMNMAQTKLQMLQSVGITPSFRTVKEAWGPEPSKAKDNDASKASPEDHDISSPTEQDKENVSPPSMEEQMYNELMKQRQEAQNRKKRFRYTTLEDTRAYLLQRNNYIRDKR